MYHINQNSDRVWSIVLENLPWLLVWRLNFTEEFLKNPTSGIGNITHKNSKILSDTSWQEIVTNKKIKDNSSGND